MLTEDEAKTKWCPFARVRGKYDDGPTSAFNRCPPFDNALVPECRCIASECMAWRQGLKRNPDWKPRHGMMSGIEEHPDAREPPYIVDAERGYCGLAGRPS